MPAADIAAALAVLTQDDRPLLMEPEPEAPPKVFDGKREKSRRLGPREGPTPRPGRPAPAARGPEGSAPARSDVPMATYRIAVGKRHKVEPRQIVGAIANEGGLQPRRTSGTSTSAATTRWWSCRRTCPTQTLLAARADPDLAAS